MRNPQLRLEVNGPLCGLKTSGPQTRTDHLCRLPKAVRPLIVPLKQIIHTL